METNRFALPQKWWKSKYLPLVIASIGYFIFFFCQNRPFANDDLVYSQYAHTMKLFDYLKWEYERWSSRLLVESVWILMFRLPLFVWQLISALCMTAILWAIYYLFLAKKSVLSVWVMCALVFLVNFNNIFASIPVVVSITYIWTIAALLIAFIPIKLIEEDHISNRWWYALFLPLAAFAGNIEICLIPLLIFSFLLSLKSLMSKKHEYYYYLMFMITICELIFALTSPGVSVRTIAETYNWYVTYGALSLIQRTALAVVILFHWVVVKYYYLFGISALFMFFIIFFDKKQIPLFKVISAIPLAAVLVLGVFQKQALQAIPALNRAFADTASEQVFAGIIQSDAYHTPKRVALLACVILTLFSYLLSIYFIFKNTKKTVICLLLIATGFLSCMMIGYSPTIYASQVRPATWAFFTLAITGGVLYEEWSKNKGALSRYVFGIAIVIIGAISMIWQIGGIIK
jgi:hypothetical protein